MRASALVQGLALVAITTWTLATSSVDATLRTTRPDTSSHEPSRCDTVCNAGGAPLCGTDRKTYANYCRYTIASCKNASLAIAYTVACIEDTNDNAENDDGDDGDDDGKAIPTSKPTRKPPAATTKASAMAQQDQEPAAFVLPIVSNYKVEDEEAQIDYCGVKCTSTEDFVCGSDGETYTNECLLLAAKCTNPKLNVASKGKCLADKCAMFCTREYEPLCGSDGVTYGNACTFSEANCLADGTLKVVVESECPKPKPKD